MVPGAPTIDSNLSRVNSVVPTQHAGTGLRRRFTVSLVLQENWRAEATQVDGLGFPIRGSGFPFTAGVLNLPCPIWRAEGTQVDSLGFQTPGHDSPFISGVLKARKWVAQGFQPRFQEVVPAIGVSPSYP